MSLPDPDAFELQGVVEGKDENGEWYSNREYVLSYDSDDAGDIDMRISQADPLFSPESIWMIVEELHDESMDPGDLKEKLREVFLDG